MRTSRTKQSFLTGEAARIAGVRHRTVDYWAKTKLIVPSIADASGTGTDRLYSFDDLIALRVARQLREAGISTQALRKAIKEIRGIPNPLAESRLLAIGSSIAWVQGSDEVTDVLKRSGQRMFAFMLDFPRAVEEIQEQVKSLRAA